MGADMVKVRFALLFIALLVAGCSHGDKLCRDINVEDVGVVELKREMIFFPIDGGRGPAAPAIGILLNVQSFPPDLTKDVLRLSLWPKYNKNETGDCKKSVLMKEKVISCNENLDEVDMTLLVQYRYPVVEMNEINYESTSRKLAEIIDFSKIGCKK
ncbi:hypothetical protein [Xanthomonas sp. SS]|uniref:hypothetical protein n=1 Tax=Xanthomonas sp. SS TaxID=2724122 RepID=UPI00163A5C4D|nr:hypothetical protein [Xanthomonas sp. SS]